MANSSKREPVPTRLCDTRPFGGDHPGGQANLGALSAPTDEIPVGPARAEYFRQLRNRVPEPTSRVPEHSDGVRGATPGLYVAPVDLKLVAEDGETVSVPEYIVAPATPHKISSNKDRIQAINDYFHRCALTRRQPRLTGLALAAGYASVAEMRRNAQRDPKMRYAIGRAFTGVAAAYEEHLMPGVNCSAAIFMLKNTPDFDSADTPYSPPSYTFKDRNEVELKVSGVKTAEDEGRDLSPREAYLRLIKNRVLEVEEEQPIETAQDDTGAFVSVQLDLDSE